MYLRKKIVNPLKSLVKALLYSKMTQFKDAIGFNVCFKLKSQHCEMFLDF